jgi:hypothetical protein
LRIGPGKADVIGVPATRGGVGRDCPHGNGQPENKDEPTAADAPVAQSFKPGFSSLGYGRRSRRRQDASTPRRAGSIGVRPYCASLTAARSYSRLSPVSVMARTRGLRAAPKRRTPGQSTTERAAGAEAVRDRPNTTGGTVTQAISATGGLGTSGYRPGRTVLALARLPTRRPRAVGPRSAVTGAGLTSLRRERTRPPP